MKRLLPLLLSLFLLASCGGPGDVSSSSSDGSKSTTITVQTFEPELVTGPASEETLFELFNSHPRYRQYNPIAWAVADDEAHGLLGVIVYEDPEIDYGYYMAYVLRDRIRPVGLGSEDAPFAGTVSDMTYLGFGRFSFVVTEDYTGNVYTYFPSYGTADGEDLLDMKVEEGAVTSDPMADSSTEIEPSTED